MPLLKPPSLLRNLWISCFIPYSVILSLQQLPQYFFSFFIGWVIWFVKILRSHLHRRCEFATTNLEPVFHRFTARNNNPLNVWIYCIERSFENVQHGSSSLGASPSLAKANRPIWEDQDLLAFGLQQPFKTANNYTKEPKQGYCLSGWRRGRASAGRRGRNWPCRLVTDRQPKLDARFRRKKYDMPPFAEVSCGYY